jgi:hypothetical protein
MGKEQHPLTSLVNTRKSSIAREQNSLANFLNALAFVHTEADTEQFRTQTRKQTIAVPIIFSLVCLYVTVGAVLDMAHHIQVHDWLHTASDLFSPLANWFLFLMLFIAFKSMQASSPLTQNVLELRQRLNDETLIPPLAEQPSAFENGVFSFEPTRIGPVRRAKGFVILGISLGIFFSLITMFFAAMIAALLPWIQGPNAATNFWAAFALSILLLFCLVFAIMMFILALRMTRASKVTVDEWGLRWAWPNLIKGRSVAMAWHEITGFYEITGQEDKGDAIKTYVLDSTTSTFIWSLKKNSTEEELQASNKLARLIITRTNLPLRDLTAAIEPFLNPLPKVKETAATRPGVI